MKQVIRRSSIIGMALLVAFTTTSARAAQTGDSNHGTPVELRFAGQLKDQLIFELTFDGNTRDNEFAIVIVDETGLTLYKGIVKGEKFSKTFSLSADEIGEHRVKFQIKSMKSKQTIVYQVNQTARVVHDVLVNKLK